MRKLVNFIVNIPSLMIGRFTWWSPPWVAFLNAQRKNSPKAFWGVFLVLMLIGGGYAYDNSRPKPALVTARVQAPAITPNVENAIPNPLRVLFHLNGSLTSVASLEMMDKELNNHIKISPALKGKWQWESENTLMFRPEKDWPAGQEYSLSFHEKLFSKSIELENYTATFSTPHFKAALSSIRFYKDPTNPQVRKVVGTLTFSHPVDSKSLEEKLSLYMQPKEASKKRSAKPYKFTLSYDDNKRQAFIHSETVSIEKDETYMYLDVAAGIKPVYGPSKTLEKLSGRVVIPSTYTFFRIQYANGQIVRDKKNDNQPDQALVIEFTDGVKSEVLSRNVKAFLLPEKRYVKRKYPVRYMWQSPSEVSSEVLSRSAPLDLEVLPTERAYSSLQSFRFRAPEGRYIFLQVSSGLKSEGGFNLSMLTPRLIRVPDYPKEAKIAFDGSLISAASEKKLTLISRGVEALKIDVGELLPGQINHLVSQTSGDIKNPSFNASWMFNEENISKLHSEIQRLNLTHPGKAIYSTIDLNRQLKKSGKKSGVFFVQINGWNPKTKQIVYRANDKRLIMVTDIGLLVKDNADKTHDVFVQSVKNGTPISGARVDVLGKNGEAVVSALTTADGHVFFPKLDDFKGAKTPVAYLVKKGGDISFIPYNRSARMINYSRFDVGGVQTRYQSKDGLNAYVFSDRGIYRPGDTVHLSAIVKQKTWESLGAIPLDIFVRNSRGENVLHKKVELSPTGFFDWELKTNYISATGLYTTAVHLVRENGRLGNMIGSTSFKVEEFQPDSMKIRTHITGDKHRGWYGVEGMQVQVSLENLFGTPAQNRAVHANMVLLPASFSFKEYKGFTFADPLLDPEKKRINVVESLKPQKTDKEGKASFSLNLDRYNKGTYRVTLTAEGFEAGGGRSVNSGSSVLVSPVKHLIGFKPDGRLSFIHKGSKRSVKFVAIDSALKQIHLTGVSKNLIERRYVSTLVKQYDGTFKYQSILKEATIKSEPFEVSDKGETLLLPSNEPGDFAIELVSAEGNKLARVLFSVAGAGNLSRSLEKNAELKVKLDRKRYHAGQVIEIQIIAPYTGAGLITIERDKVYAYKWFKTNKTSTVQSIRIPEGLEGNGYINVSFIRAADSKEIFVSPLSYSAIPFSVGREQREIKITLDSPEQVKPGELLKIRYKTSKASKIVMIAVDEGILQVAKYKTPKPLSYFFKKQALEVKTFQIVDLILPEYQLAMNLAAAGGGDKARRAIGKNLNPFRRVTDAPIAFWSGLLDADTQEREYNIEVPDYFNGSLRIMAVAVSQEAIGAARHDTVVKGPFVISPNAPVVVAPEDEFEVTVGVSNNLEGSGENASIKVALVPSKHLSVIGDPHKIVMVSEGSESKLTFRVKATHNLGSGSMKFTASHAGKSSQLTTTLSIRPAVPHMATFVSHYEKSGEASVLLKRKLVPNYAEQLASGSHSPLVMVEGLGVYLQNFAHGCAEQMVSKVFPYLGLLNHPRYSVDKSKVRKDFETVMMSLRSRQTAEGGFRFWSGQGVTQGIDFPSVYIMHFLTDAKQLGYPVPHDVLRRGLDYLMNIARRSSNSIELARLRAYAIYIMTRNQVMTANYLIDLNRELESTYQHSWMNDITSTYMAASFQLLKNKPLQQRMLKGYKFNTDKKHLTSDFDSKLNQDAQYMYLLAKHFPNQFEDKVGVEALMAIVEPLNRGDYNTLSASYSMLALGAYTRHFKGAANDDLIKINSVDVGGKKHVLKTNVGAFAKANFPVSSETIEFHAGKNLFYVLSQAGYDRELPKEEIREGLEVYRDYYNKAGEAISSAAIGSEVEVRIRIRTLNNASATNVAVVDLLPGGFEIIRGSFTSRNVSHGWRSHKDIREDRIVIYGDFGSDVSEYRYKVKLTAKGNFTIPSIYAGSMYKRHLHARSVAGEFKVVGRE